MKKIPLSNIVQKIHAQKDMPIEDIEKMIASKVSELSGLVSEEGAAHIIANELGVPLFSESQVLKIKDILVNMKDFALTARVVAAFDMVTFQKDSNPGKVKTCILGDETGKIKATFWHHAADTIKDIQVGDIVKLSKVSSKENNKQLEISVSFEDAIVINPEGVSIKVNENQETQKIIDLTQGQGVILGTIVQAFRPNFYDRCPECGKKVVDSKCPVHGEVTAIKACILNIIVDDGLGSIRCVLFNDVAEKVSELAIADMDDVEKIKAKVIGKMCKFSGNVRYSTYIEDNEMIVNNVLPFDLETEKAQLENKLES
ncbi:MAG: OB-fold nucleic acid binding domain-containing protein [Candidatus Woesearchaeota archaeon]